MDTTLSLKDITKDFGTGPVLAGITLTIHPGELVAVMGPSGSGKSTLLHCVSGILRPSHGSVHFGDQELSALDDAQRSRLRLRHFGFVFQDGQLIPELKIVDNVMLPALLNGINKKTAREKAMNLLEQLGLSAYAERRPGKLSGGQAQRVALARALVANPAVVFADEPTGALDQSSGHGVMQLLTTVVRTAGASLVMVTHDSKVASWMERRVEIRDGLVHDDVILEAHNR